MWAEHQRKSRIAGQAALEEFGHLVETFRTAFRRHDLVGPEPWVVGPPLAVDWPRYQAFFTDWGIAIWSAIRRNRLGG